MTGLSVNFFTLLLAQVKYIVYLWGINFSAVFIFIVEIKKYYIMKYSILDLKNDFNIEENTVDVYFQDKFVMTVNQLGDNNLPSLVCHPSHTINEYLEEPFIIAGGYNNSDLYTIRGEKLTDFKFWAILSSPIIYKNNLYFKVRTSKGKTGIINDKGDVVIPFVYDEDISLSGFINIEENGLLYVKKDNLYGIINLKNETMLDFQPSKDVVMIRRLKDLNEWDDLLYVVVDGKLYSRKYYKK